MQAQHAKVLGCGFESAQREHLVLVPSSPVKAAADVSSEIRCVRVASFCASKTSRLLAHAARPTDAAGADHRLSQCTSTLAARWDAARCSVKRGERSNSCETKLAVTRSAQRRTHPGPSLSLPKQALLHCTPPAKFRAPQKRCRPSAGNRSRPRAQMWPKGSRRRAGRPCAAAPRHRQNKPLTRSSSRRAWPPRR